MTVALVACEGLTPPARDPGYPFTDLVGLHFHWPADRLPVRYWVAPASGNLAEYVQAGIHAWREQLLYGEFDAMLVEDSSAADVLVRVTPADPPTDAVTVREPVVAACEGVTLFDTTTSVVGPRLDGPMRVVVSWDARIPAGDVVNCLARVTMHEIGHTMGIFSHSLDGQDLMNGLPRVSMPSPRDQATIQRVYHTPPDLAPPALARLRP